MNSNTQEPIVPGERQSTDRVYFDKLKERMQNFRERVEIIEVRFVMTLSSTASDVCKLSPSTLCGGSGLRSWG